MKKRILIALLALICIFALCSCNGNTITEKGENITLTVKGLESKKLKISLSGSFPNGSEIRFENDEEPLVLLTQTKSAKNKAEFSATANASGLDTIEIFLEKDGETVAKVAIFTETSDDLKFISAELLLEENISGVELISEKDLTVLLSRVSSNTVTLKLVSKDSNWGASSYDNNIVNVFMISENQISETEAENLWQIIAKEQGDTTLEISNSELGKTIKFTLLSAQKDNEFLLEIFDADIVTAQETEEEEAKYYSEAEIKEINKTSITPYIPEGTKITNVRYNDEGEEFLITEFDYSDVLGVMTLRKIDAAQFKSEKSKMVKESKVMKVNDVDFYCYGKDSIDTVIWHSNGLSGEIFFRSYVNTEEFIPKFFASYK